MSGAELWTSILSDGGEMVYPGLGFHISEKGTISKERGKSHPRERVLEQGSVKRQNVSILNSSTGVAPSSRTLPWDHTDVYSDKWGEWAYQFSKV